MGYKKKGGHVVGHETALTQQPKECANGHRAF
jgi:hypothetical protein